MGWQEVTVREAIGQAIDEEMERDGDVFILGEEVGKFQGPYKVTKGLLSKWGNGRVLDTPISEGGFMGLAVGAAMTGLRPIVDLMSWSFSFVGCDQIISNASQMYYMSNGRFRVPIVFRGPNGAGSQLSCQHSHSVESLYSSFPGLIVLYPSNAYDCKGLLKAAIRNDNPVIFLESEVLYGKKMKIPEEDYTVPIGRGNVVSDGEDITMVSYGRMMGVCLEAVKELKVKGISVELIDLRSIKPLDVSLIARSVKKTHACVVVEDCNQFCGLGGEIAYTIMDTCFDFLEFPVKRISRRETPMPYSKMLEGKVLPDVERVVSIILGTYERVL